MHGMSGAALLVAASWAAAVVEGRQCHCNGAVDPGLQSLYWKNAETTGLSRVPNLAEGSSLRETQPTFEAVSPTVNFPRNSWPGLPAEIVHDFVSLHTGLLRVEVGGDYVFSVRSDDGALVYINEELAIDFDGLHGMGPGKQSQVINLAPGLYPVRVEFFQRRGGYGLILQWKPPGATAQAVIPAANFGRCAGYCNSVATGPGSATLADLQEMRERNAALEEAVTTLTRKLSAMEGVVAAVGRQLVDIETRTQERLRAQGQSGLTVARAYTDGTGTDTYYEASYSGNGMASMHNHANFISTIGMGEFGAVLNGVQFTTRHNDYLLNEPNPSLSAGDFTARWPPPATPISHGVVPPSVLNAGSVEAQIQEMRQYFRAFHNQDKSIRSDYDDYFRPIFCYLEGAWTEAEAELRDPFASDRHAIDAETWAALNEKNHFLFNSGQKNNLENLPYLPSSFRGMGARRNGTRRPFEPQQGQWFYRISCKPTTKRIETGRFRVRNDLHTQMREAKPATRAKLAEGTRALFDLNPARNWAPGKPWPKGQLGGSFLDDLMAEVPGFEGPNGDLRDKAFGPTCMTLNGKDELNTARYSRYYSLLNKDAMGRSRKKRAFNDLMFAAQTTHKRVSPQTVCERIEGASPEAQEEAEKRQDVCKALRKRDQCTGHAGWDAAQGASYGKCAYTTRGQCEYQACWEQRWSYAIPLEVVYMTPLSVWDPYNIGFAERGAPEFDEVDNGRTGTADKPYKGANRRTFYRTPAAFFKDGAADVDPADTGVGVKHVLDKDGKVRQVRASGHWIHFPEIDGVGKVRQRYPMFPVHEAGSTTWKEAKALEELVVAQNGRRGAEVAAILAEAAAVSGAFGAELRVEGGGHSHDIHLTSQEVADLKGGRAKYVMKATGLANGHTHFVKLLYTRSKGEFSIEWCTLSSDAAQCPAATIATGGCDAACCVHRCLDGHTHVSTV